MREENILMRREYEFYKDLADQLESKQTSEVGSLAKELRLLKEKEKDYQVQSEIL